MTRSIADSMIGKYVKSNAVGKKAEFNGIVLERHSGTLLAWIVEDLSDGSRWHREFRELTVLKGRPHVRKKKSALVLTP